MLGNHVLADLYDCENKFLNNRSKVEAFMQEAAIESGATIVNTVIHQFNPIGVSGVVVIAESHLAIHTWPEYNFVAVDAFTCGDLLDPKNPITLLAQKFRAGKVELKIQPRGEMVKTQPDPQVIQVKSEVLQ